MAIRQMTDGRNYYRHDMYSPVTCLGYLLKVADARTVSQLDRKFTDLGFSFAQWGVLLALEETGSTTASTLARLICRDPGSLSRLIDSLGRKGLIVRKRKLSDRRAAALDLTSKGRRLTGQLKRQVVSFWNETLREFRGSEVEALIKLLARLVLAGSDRRSRQIS